MLKMKFLVCLILVSGVQPRPQGPVVTEVTTVAGITGEGNLYKILGDPERCHNPLG